MPLSLPHGKQYKAVHRLLPASFEMPLLEAASDHYALCFILKGDRTVITPTMNYTLHSGNITTLAPFLYHRTVPASGVEYESILIKFTREFAQPLIDRLGSHVFDEIYKAPAKTFSEENERNIFRLANELVEIENSYTESDPDDSSERILKDFKFQCVLFTILVAIYENGKECVDSRAHSAPLTKPIVDAVYYIEKNYSKNLPIQEVADVSGYSVFYFSRIFQAQLGSSFSEYLTNVRLKHVQNDLLTTQKNITEIAIGNGFSYPGNMTNCFKKAFGITPLQYRKASLKK